MANITSGQEMRMSNNGKNIYKEEWFVNTHYIPTKNE